MSVIRGVLSSTKSLNVFIPPICGVCPHNSFNYRLTVVSEQWCYLFSTDRVVIFLKPPNIEADKLRFVCSQYCYSFRHIQRNVILFNDIVEYNRSLCILQSSALSATSKSRGTHPTPSILTRRYLHR